MITLLFFLAGLALIVTGIAALVLIWIARDIGDSPETAKRRRWPWVLTIIGGVVIFIAGTAFTEVPAGQVGVVTRFGKVQDQTLDPGLHIIAPFVDNVHVLDTRVITYAFSDIEAFTKENQPAKLVGIVNYRIDPAVASTLYQTVGMDYARKLIESQADTQLKALARNFGVDEITSKRDEMGTEVQAALQENVDPYDITIDGVFIRDIGLSGDYLASVEQKQIASQNLSRAATEANTLRTKAQGEADAQAIIADGQARANERIVSSLTPELIQWETIFKLADKVRIALVPSDSGFIWNLNGITADTLETTP